MSGPLLPAQQPAPTDSSATSTQPSPQPIVIEQRIDARPRGGFRSWLLYVVLMGSLAANFGMFSAYQEYFADTSGPSEHYHSGEKGASNSKLALIRVSGTIMPPFTDRILKSIKHAKDDSKVKGVLLVVNSPGGLVADSHQIYHRLAELRETKPVVVYMESMAASGGYYVAMGAGEKGKIFAEPTTWTGSIGVIIPRYEVAQLAEKWGIKSDPLKTGKFKDALSPFRELSPDERQVWDNILNQAFDQFLHVIDDNRPKLNFDQVKALATGQVYTAQDALKNGLIDAIGYEEDALNELKKAANLEQARVITYRYQLGLVDVLTGSTQAPDPAAEWRALLEATIPRAMYYFSWGPIVPVPAAN